MKPTVRLVGLAGLVLLLFVAFVAVRVPGWLRPQEAQFAIVHQSRRYVDVKDFARGAESRDLVPLNEYAILAAEVYDVDPDLTERVKALGWIRCVRCAGIESQAAKGLGFKTWLKRRQSGLPLAAIAFRGTRAHEVDDWKSNFRWLLLYVPGREDQYDLVQKLIPPLLPEIDREAGAAAELVTTGHSLGGGLAQQAGYMTARIARVYAFDPSPVTGFYDLKKADREAASVGKRIYRIYEHGEILAYLRLILKAFYPVADRNPEIVELRFNLTNGNFISQHNMANLAHELDRLTQEK